MSKTQNAGKLVIDPEELRTFVDDKTLDKICAWLNKDDSSPLGLGDWLARLIIIAIVGFLLLQFVIPLF